MAKLKIYGAAFWPHCNPVKEYLLDKGIEFDYYDIMENEEHKTNFYELRPKYAEYKEILEKGTSYGIPALFFNDEVLISPSSEEMDIMIKKL